MNEETKTEELDGSPFFLLMKRIVTIFTLVSSAILHVVDKSDKKSSRYDFVIFTLLAEVCF